MTHTYTLLHGCCDGLHLFTADSLEEAHLLLIRRLRSEAQPGDLLAIVTGPDDELIYYKRVHKVTQSVSSNWLVSGWMKLKQRTAYALARISLGVFLPTH